MKKVTYIISNIDKALAFEWIALHLDQRKIELSFILLNPNRSYLQEFLEQHQIPVLHIPYHGKKDLPLSIFKIYSFLKQHKTDTVHTHFLDANLIGLLAAKLANIKQRIHTRHHGSEHHVFAPKGVKYDKLVNRLSTDIVVISQNVASILSEKENVKQEKMRLINHGFDFSLFQQHKKQNISALKEKYSITTQTPVIGVISRYTKGKGIQYIIPAFKKLLQKYPKALLVLANAKGDYQQEINTLLKEIPSKNYLEISFEKEIHTLYQLFDIFVHVPINEHYESFGQIYIEALVSKIPSIFTLSGVATEFIKHKHNAWVVDFENSEQIEEGFIELLTNFSLKNKLIENGEKSCEQFALQPFIEKLNHLYSIKH